MESDSQWDELERWFLARAEVDPRACFQLLRFSYAYTLSRTLFKVISLTGEIAMARGKSKEKSTALPSKAKWVGFVNIRVGEDDEQAINEFCSDSDFVFDSMVGILEHGHKVTFTYDNRNDATICSITGELDSSPNAGYTLTTFAATWYQALQVAVYKHLVLAKGKWSTVATEPERPRFG